MAKSGISMDVENSRWRFWSLGSATNGPRAPSPSGRWAWGPILRSCGLGTTKPRCFVAERLGLAEPARCRSPERMSVVQVAGLSVLQGRECSVIAGQQPGS